MRSRGLGQRPGDKAFNGSAIMGTEGPGLANERAEGSIEGEGVAGELLKASGEPFVAHVEAHDQPEPGHTGISKQELSNRRLGNLGRLPGFDSCKDTHLFPSLGNEIVSVTSGRMPRHSLVRVAFLFGSVSSMRKHTA